MEELDYAFLCLDVTALPWKKAFYIRFLGHQDAPLKETVLTAAEWQTVSDFLQVEFFTTEVMSALAHEQLWSIKVSGDFHATVAKVRELVEICYGEQIDPTGRDADTLHHLLKAYPEQVYKHFDLHGYQGYSRDLNTMQTLVRPDKPQTLVNAHH